MMMFLMRPLLHSHNWDSWWHLGSYTSWLSHLRKIKPISNACLFRFKARESESCENERQEICPPVLTRFQTSHSWSYYLKEALKGWMEYLSLSSQTVEHNNCLRSYFKRHFTTLFCNNPSTISNIQYKLFEHLGNILSSILSSIRNKVNMIP